MSGYYRIVLEALFDRLFCYNIAENISERIRATYFSRFRSGPYSPLRMRLISTNFITRRHQTGGRIISQIFVELNHVSIWIANEYGVHILKAKMAYNLDTFSAKKAFRLSRKSILSAICV